MSEDNVKIYPFITTPIGKHKLSQATSGGIPVNLTHIAVGDGGGSEYDPVKGQTDLKNKVWCGEIERKVIHPEDPNVVIVIGEIPHDIGGFFIRELSLIDEDGDAIYISAYPASYKPTPKSNISKDMVLEQWLIVEDIEAVTLTPDPNVSRATLGDLQQLENKLAESDKATEEIATIRHNLGRYPHCELYRTRYALGVAGLGEGPLGGENMVSISAAFEHIEKHSITVRVPKSYIRGKMEVCKLSNDMFSLIYPDGVESLILILR